jgi:hypothetical protein
LGWLEIDSDLTDVRDHIEEFIEVYPNQNA